MQCGATAEIINEKKVLHKTLELEINAWYSKASSSKGKYNITELNWKRNGRDYGKRNERFI